MNNNESFTLGEWAKSLIASADHTEEFAATIEPLAQQLQELCTEHGVPVCMVFGLKNDIMGDDTHVMQALPSDPRLVGAGLMKVLVAANQIAVPLESVEIAASFRAQRTLGESATCTRQ